MSEIIFHSQVYRVTILQEIEKKLAEIEIHFTFNEFVGKFLSYCQEI
jgi:hypothetical protein